MLQSFEYNSRLRIKNECVSRAAAGKKNGKTTKQKKGCKIVLWLDRSSGYIAALLFISGGKSKKKLDQLAFFCSAIYYLIPLIVHQQWGCYLPLLFGQNYSTQRGKGRGSNFMTFSICQFPPPPEKERVLLDRFPHSVSAPFLTPLFSFF